MRDHLILLPGWGLGSAPLEPLRDALHEREPHLNVLIEPLPSLDDAADWLDELDDNLPRDSWLAGWSLGGMLAGELAARRGDDCRGLLTLASNPCFRVREDWPNAMPAETFEDFFEAFLLEPHLTRKRFTLLVSQGARDPRTLARQLQVALPQLEREALVAGLQPGEFIWTGGDCHLYANHLEQADLQLTREPLPLPSMKLNPEVKDLFDFRFEDFELVGYEAHPHIKAPVAV